MSLFHNRFPTWRESILLFLVCLIPTHIWSILVFFTVLPGLVLQLGYTDIIGVAAYQFTYTFAESFIIFIFLEVLAIILPRKIFRDQFLPKSSILVLITSLCATLYHALSKFIPKVYLDWEKFIYILNSWLQLDFLHTLDSPLAFATILMFTIFGSLAMTLVSIPRFVRRYESNIIKFIDRLTVLSIFYLSLDVFSIFIVIILNIN